MIKKDSEIKFDLDEKGNSLLISFGNIGEKTIESDAKVLVSFCEDGLAGIEMLFDDKEVAKKLREEGFDA